MEKNRIIFIKGERIDLCVLDPDRHLEKCLQWVNDQNVTKWMLNGLKPCTRREEEDWFEKHSEDKNAIILAIEKKDGKYLGNVSLSKIDLISGTAELGIMIGAKDEWGKGYGTEAEKLIIKHGFRNLGLRKIWAIIMSENIGSIKAAQKSGLQIEAKINKHIRRNGKLQDIFHLAIFREDWEIFESLLLHKENVRMR